MVNNLEDLTTEMFTRGKDGAFRAGIHWKTSTDPGRAECYQYDTVAAVLACVNDYLDQFDMLAIEVVTWTRPGYQGMKKLWTWEAETIMVGGLPKEDMACRFVLAGANSLFNFYPTMEAAKADQARANSDKGWGPYEPMTFSLYKRRERQYWLIQPATQVTEEDFTRMLECLPPKYWEQQPGFNSFLMAEHMSGPYTSQYARYGYGDTATYWSKIVDAGNRETWMKRDAEPGGVRRKEGVSVAS